MIEKTRIGAGMVGPYSELLMISAAWIVGGATAHGLYQWQSSRQAGAVYSLLDFVISFALAIFSGVVFAFAAQQITTDPEQIYITCSMGAFMGVRGINSIANIVLDAFGKGRASAKD